MESGVTKDEVSIKELSQLKLGFLLNVPTEHSETDLDLNGGGLRPS